MPLVQLNFPNPLNVSVQLGDVAYFSNPTPVGIDGIPIPYTTTSSGVPWTSTTTPHLTNEQQDIKKIGEIVEIILWDGTTSAIICDMPQDLFNQYFTLIVTQSCVPDPSGPDILITDTVFTDIYGRDPSCLSLPQFNNETDLLNVAFSAGNYSTSFLEIGKFPRQCNPLQGSFGTASQYSFPDNGITHCETGNGDCWSRLDDISIYTLGEHAGDATPPHPGGLVQFTNAFDCLDHLINHDSWNLTLNSSYTDVLNEANNQGTFFPQSLAFSPCFCQGPLEICSDGGSFIMFSKDNKVNMSSILGYYASVEFRNNSKIKSEIFNVGTDFFESSK